MQEKNSSKSLPVECVEEVGKEDKSKIYNLKTDIDVLENEFAAENKINSGLHGILRNFSIKCLLK